jgi:hypothetical protein
MRPDELISRTALQRSGRRAEAVVVPLERRALVRDPIDVDCSPGRHVTRDLAAHVATIQKRDDPAATAQPRVTLLLITSLLSSR